RAARDAIQEGSHDTGRQHGARRVRVALARRHCRSAVLDCADSAPRSSLRQRIAPSTRAVAGALVHFRLARSQSFLEGVPHGLRHDAGPGAEAAGALGYLSPDPARGCDGLHGCALTLLRSAAADGAATELS